jgi:murein DD-endopeptidase MepM/ murein hydrolase activator NlpD
VEVGADAASRRPAPFEVAAKEYPVQHVRIKDQRKVTPAADDMRRIEREQVIINEVKRLWRDEPDPDLALRLPAQGPLSSRFGLRRVFNGEPRAPHSGLDVSVPLGAPVVSAARGVVANTGDYFFNGNTVFVDHGQGLVTMYCHLSRIDVKPGDQVASGQTVGLAGKTGRASGPHLHWTVMLNGASVDPELFLR